MMAVTQNAAYAVLELTSAAGDAADEALQPLCIKLLYASWLLGMMGFCCLLCKPDVTSCLRLAQDAPVHLCFLRNKTACRGQASSDKTNVKTEAVGTRKSNDPKVG